MADGSYSSLNMDSVRKGISTLSSKMKISSAAASKTLSEQMSVASDRLKDYFASPTPADHLVDAATAETLIGPNWGKNLELCDHINSDHDQVTTTDVARAIKRRLTLPQPHVQMLALALLETMAKNCEKMFQDIAGEKVLDEMVKIADEPSAAVELREKSLKIIESWGEATEELRYLPVFEETYKSLKSRGLRFPGRDAESLGPIFTPPATHPVAPRPRDAPPVVRDPQEVFAVARNSCELLTTVLTSAPEQEALEDEVTETLVRQCHSSQLAIQRLIAESADDDTVLFEALAVHDELEKVLAKHAAMVPSQTHGEAEPAALVAMSAGEEEESGEEAGLVRNKPAGGAGSTEDEAAMDKLDAMIFGSSKGKKKDGNDMIEF